MYCALQDVLKQYVISPLPNIVKICLDPDHGKSFNADLDNSSLQGGMGEGEDDNRALALQQCIYSPPTNRNFLVDQMSICNSDQSYLSVKNICYNV